MEREEFLKTLGISLALACTGSCFQACKKGDDPSPGTGAGTGTGTGIGSNTASVDISTLAAVGSQTTINGVLFFRVAAGASASSFVAIEAICPHEGGTLTWQQSSSKIQCGSHQSTYTTTGSVLSQPVGGGSTRALKVYSTTLTGTTLTATKS